MNESNERLLQRMRQVKVSKTDIQPEKRAEVNDADARHVRRMLRLPEPKSQKPERKTNDH